MKSFKLFGVRFIKEVDFNNLEIYKPDRKLYCLYSYNFRSHTIYNVNYLWYASKSFRKRCLCISFGSDIIYTRRLKESRDVLIKISDNLKCLQKLKKKQELLS